MSHEYEYEKLLKGTISKIFEDLPKADRHTILSEQLSEEFHLDDDVDAVANIIMGAVDVHTVRELVAALRAKADEHEKKNASILAKEFEIDGVRWKLAQFQSVPFQDAFEQTDDNWTLPAPSTLIRDGVEAVERAFDGKVPAGTLVWADIAPRGGFGVAFDYHTAEIVPVPTSTSCAVLLVRSA